MTLLGWKRCAFAAVLAAPALSACTGNGSTYAVNPIPPTPPPAGALVRFINASPDAGPVDVALTNGAAPVFAGVPYVPSASGFGHGGAGKTCESGICGYLKATAGTQAVAVFAAGSDVTPIITSNSVVVSPHQRVTIVLAGERGNGTLQIQAFGEIPYVTNSTSASVSFHDASPVSATGNPWSPGAFPVTNPSGGTGFQPPISFPPTGETLVTDISTPLPSLGIGFFLFPVSGPGKSLVFTPNQLDSTNANNVMPFASTNPLLNNEQNLSLYLIDGPNVVSGYAPVLVGIFDPNG